MMQTRTSIDTVTTGDETAPDDEYACALEQLFGASPRDWAPAGVSPFARVRVAAEAPLIHEGATACCVYVVQAGYFKSVRAGEDGYEHVIDFACRHDLLGCDSLTRGRYVSSAVALEESWVHALPVADLPRLAQRLPHFGGRFQAAMSAQLARAGERSWLMAAVGAEKRTARFIILYARRMAETGQSGRRLRLRMARRDIASHLGLANESVSRSFTMLSDAGILRVDNREIEIINCAALQDFALNTRGYSEAHAKRHVGERVERALPIVLDGPVDALHRRTTVERTQRAERRERSLSSVHAPSGLAAVS